jgi:hypothetical protein
MFKGGIPPFKKVNKNLIKITKEKTFNPNLLISSMLDKKDKKEN